MNHPTDRRPLVLLAGPVLLAALVLLVLGQAHAAPPGPPSKPLPPPRPQHALANQIIPGFPLSMTVEDLGSLQIRYRDYNARGRREPASRAHKGAPL